MTTQKFLGTTKRMASDIATRITDGTPKVTITRTPTPVRACLIQYSGDALGRRYQLDAPEILVGRAQECGIVLVDGSVSREHAKIYSSGEVFEVEDNHSSNGTYVQNQRISNRTPLTDGAILRFGSVLFKFFAKDNIESAFHDNIYRMATIDAATQLFNKKYLLETLESEFRLCRVYGRPLAVVYYDLDFFKKVNDTHGHNCGDYILRECAQVAKSCMRTNDILARFGGEEFVAVLPGADAATAAELAERIRKAIEDHAFEFEGKQLTQTVSMGVSEIQPAFQKPEDLLEDADRKLYQSKQGGRNRITT
jgi:diguanylate cyclase (GGDEF)-like protein